MFWDDRLVTYDFGAEHPMNPVRVELTMALARELGVFDAPHVSVEGFEPAGDDLLTLVHDPAYIEAVRRERLDVARGLGLADNPVFSGMHDASALVAGASVAAARAVWTGEAEHAANIAGGLHHAMHGAASGFCVYNDPAIAIAWLLGQGAERVAYVDVDVHHGDGVQAAFYDDPRVLTISLHETPRTLFPGTGLPKETGARGTAVNVALPPGSGDRHWLRAFDAVVPPLLRQFRPQVLVTQQGCDSHELDPLAHLTLSVDGQRAAYAALHRLAHETAGGRWVLTGGGGYELVHVVPRAWTHLLAEAAGRPIPPGTPTPESWRELVRDRTGRRAPERMTDGADTEVRTWESGYDPADPVDRAVQATRQAVFPEHGLDPMP
ncbi:acetoin utilization protein AcuC [Actinoallomurus rhizosphaericola]|uniref:acetoin utilization protein AcuC n=1 Tax=Actinoallomurus rhizosphaericola TaxID=2952536 RepID=UPI0020900AF7|nr:acetoin utilization protein AcuC [Actinoallomurus rhizosphaericola]MCO5994468.1 acetoin utilization protein AcuC [Actinoallomurus rhizosphaericola]